MMNACNESITVLNECRSVQLNFHCNKLLCTTIINFKAMKKLLFIFFSIPVLFFLISWYAVQPKNFVIDQSNILDSTQRKKLNDLYVNHEKLTTNQVVLLTTDSFYPDSTIEEYSTHQFNAIGIGRKDINNGVLIIFSAHMKKVRITTGYGTEKVLTNAIAQSIIDSLMIPQFKQQKYFEGLWNGSIAITKLLEKPENKIR